MTTEEQAEHAELRREILSLVAAAKTLYSNLTEARSRVASMEQRYGCHVELLEELAKSANRHPAAGMDCIPSELIDRVRNLLGSEKGR